MTDPKLQTIGLSAWYGRKQVLYDISLDVPDRAVTAIIGPSGCGKSTFLRCLNRLHEETPRARIEGKILLDGEDLATKGVVSVRFRVGMVFQKPTPFPNMSIFENVAAGLRLLGVHERQALDDGVYDALQHAGLWEEVEDILDAPGTSLSGGQQQRLCIARALAVRPEVLLLDEPCSALDPIATAKIENLIAKLRSDYTVIVVTHNLAQATRVSDYTAFLYLGKLVEAGTTDQLFHRPVEKLTENYVNGRFG
ncbi:MAG TPA: phosphate ABC transporter ATP-binding protein PstB [Thermoplasmata archaeon]|nr:phosphate ABC transporter ATP-binding protein PstB [Thermoplasmata archaeon]